MHQAIIIATGDELLEGSVLESNSRHYSIKLVEMGITTPLKIIVRDNIQDIKSTLDYATNFKPKIITLSGGLGPTTDDLTRYALAQHLKLDLVEDQSSIIHMQDRFAKFNYVLTDNNKQQALFPIGATIIPNRNGSANGCYLTSNDILYFMLPGPPQEALPMYDEYVVPQLRKYQQTLYHKNYVTIGFAEAVIAKKFEEILAGRGYHFGYCFRYPYVECKLTSSEPIMVSNAELEQIFGDRLVDDQGRDAFTLLASILHQTNFKIELSAGRLECFFRVALWEARQRFNLPDSESPSARIIKIEISGLAELWNNQPFAGQTEVRAIISKQGEIIKDESISFGFRNSKVVDFAIHFAAFIAYNAISKIS